MSKMGQYNSLNATVESLTGDTGVIAYPLGGNIDVLGGSNLNTHGTVNTITINLEDSVSISGTFDAVGDITSSAGDIETTLGNFLAPAGFITVNLDVTSSTGDIVSSLGSVAAVVGNVSAGANITAGGDVSADDEVTAVNNITTSTGDIVSTLGAGSFATTVTAGTGVNVLTGDVDVADGNIDLPNTTAAPIGVVRWGGIRYIHNAGDECLFFGSNAGNFTVTGKQNTCCGATSGVALTSGNHNSAYSNASLQHLTTGMHNTSFGSNSLLNLVSGNYNTALGEEAGEHYNGAENSNLCINNVGETGDDHKIRIGTQGSGNRQQDNTFICGIHGVTPAGATQYVIIDADCEMGSTTAFGVEAITAGTNLNNSGTATNPILNLDDPITLATVNATTFDTNVAAAGVTLAGTSLIADGTDLNIDINITAKGTGQVIIDDLQLTTDLEIQYGGTGVSTLTQYGVLLGNAATDIQALAVGTTNTVLLGNTGANPSWGAVDLTTDITGILPIANGGTNANSMVNTYGINYFDGTSIVTTTVGTATQVLTSNGVGVAPTFQDSTSGTVTSVSGGVNITASGTAADPVMDLDATITLTTVNATTFDTNVAAAAVTLAGTSLIADGTDANIDINITAKGTGQVIIDDLQLTTPLAIAYGGTNANTMATTYGVNYFDGTSLVTTAVGTANQVLTSNGVGVAPTFQDASGINMTIHTDAGDATEAADAFTVAGTANEIETSGAGSTVTIGLPNAVTIGTLTLTNDLTVTEGGTGAGTFTDHGLLIGSGATAITALAEASNGQIPIGSVGADPVLATITEGVGITVENSAGSISLSSTKTTLRNDTSTGFTLALVDSGKHITCTNAAAISIVVPTNAAVTFPIGTMISFSQNGVGQITFSGAAPPTLRSADSALTTVKQYSVCACIKIATDEWIFGGDLEA